MNADVMVGFGPKRNKSGDDEPSRAIRAALGERSVVLVGLMGCGKSTVGRRLAARLGLPFVDADDEIERAARKTIPEIFADHGEEAFRDGERKVISRLLCNGPQILATGGGAYMSEETRASIKSHGIAIWLKAELDVLMKRVRRRVDRPLLKVDDPEAVMKNLMALRYPIYAEADLTVESREVPHETMVDDIIDGLLNGPLADPRPDEPATSSPTPPQSQDPS